MRVFILISQDDVAAKTKWDKVELQKIMGEGKTQRTVKTFETFESILARSTHGQKGTVNGHVTRRQPMGFKWEKISLWLENAKTLQEKRSTLALPARDSLYVVASVYTCVTKQCLYRYLPQTLRFTQVFPNEQCQRSTTSPT